MRSALLVVAVAFVACSAEPGPPGPKGDPGLKGDPGPPGMPGMNATAKFYSARAEQVGVGPSTSKTPIALSINCDAGDVATGGSCWVVIDTGNGMPTEGGFTGAPVVDPPNAATGWNCDYDAGWSGVTVTATVLCASID